MAEEKTQMSLDGILNDEKREAPEAPQEPASAEPKADPYKSLKKEHQEKEFAAQGRDPETGKFVPKEEPKAEPKEEPKPEVKAAPPPQQMTDKERAGFAAAADERRKRQALEQELATLRAKPPEPPKAFWDDPEGALKTQQQEMAGLELKMTVRVSEQLARGRHTDYDEKIAVFAQLAQTVPGLAQQWLASQDPAEYAYILGKNHMELQQVGSLDAMRAKIEQETETKVRAKIEAEYKAKAEALAAEKAKIPGSLSGTPSTGSHRPVWDGPTSFDNILKH